jgi:hypothetical protein
MEGAIRSSGAADGGCLKWRNNGASGWMTPEQYIARVRRQLASPLEPETSLKNGFVVRLTLVIPDREDQRPSDEVGLVRDQLKSAAERVERDPYYGEPRTIYTLPSVAALMRFRDVAHVRLDVSGPRATR